MLTYDKEKLKQDHERNRPKLSRTLLFNICYNVVY